jgi:phenylacetate-CoA ligase
VTLAEAIRLGVPLAPKVVVSSAVSLSPAQAAHVAKAWGSTVIDLYSTTETGPIAVSVAGIRGHVVLVPDLYVEALDASGERVPDGERGEITVTGGRNPFLPLIRYRTGDFGRLTTVTLKHGRPARCILDLEGRAPVTFRAADGSRVGSVDIARRIRPISPFVQHALYQRADGSVELRLLPIPNVPIAVADFEEVLLDLFGRSAKVSVVVDERIGAGGGKVVAWRSDVS